MSRLQHLDALRGLAIVTMVAANMTPYYLHEPHPPWLRLYGSFAAPLFIGITGYLAAMQVERGNSTRGRWLRGGLILLIAAAIDLLLWRIWPFVAFDVLYVIGIASLVLPVACRGGTWGLLAATVVPIVAAIILQVYPGYDSDLHIVRVQNPISEINPYYALEQLCISGYFPIFPWVGVAALGGLVYHCREKLIAFTEPRQRVLLPLLILLSMGLGGYLAWGQNRFTRGGYCELFYPPDAAYLLTAGVVCLLLAFVFRATRGQAWQQPLAALGQSSLFFYLFHLLLIVLFAGRATKHLTNYFAWQLLFLGLMLGVTLPLVQVRKMLPHRPLWLRMLIG